MSKQIIIGPGHYETDEREAGADVDPGELVEFNDDGRVQPHSTDGGVAAARFAKEARDVGKTVDSTYEYDSEEDEGENVHYGYPAPGTPVQAFIATDETFDDDTPLVSNGDGSLREAADDGSEDEAIVAYANEAVDTSGDDDPTRHEVISA
ncbi:hypothetical protein [Natronobacterium gregoryi]|uniref:Uncharacterized protein n=2 Tax=Natronobacterium gregoryi TaxID=44930 RepID=L0AHW4_NATGS|nr:hypothetical protein [Natronobacterium gregoryi]AFZ73034.1 hypothetical protein Natgr_1849 [Natronobacterium gregoryi SP2]ELY70703.1 hypothetical protein C490_06194 [Natronobacterium gregoryi SP2]PLK20439.1 hypothetical protein CYV19_09940 [Natronobacterium gregoryi SP2]SFI63079.1 hypothetical protein SAMN05443661_102232 [Natronobacterium gregoryi]